MKISRKLKIRLVFLLILFSNYTFAQHNVTVSVNEKIIDAESGTYNSVAAGDTVFLEKGTREFVLVKNFHGSESLPIVFINYKGLVDIDSDSNYGFSFRSCSHIKLTGSGDGAKKYGIRISDLRSLNSIGIAITEKSTDIEIEYVEIANCGFSGILAKTDPNFTLTAVRDSFTQYNTILHNLYIHDVGGEGVYVGHSRYNGYYIYSQGDSLFVYPHLLNGVKIYDNIIENTGYDGIQVSSTTKNCDIYNNTIINDSRANVEIQMSGIILGGGSKCECYNNKILYGNGTGILVFGLGGTKIYNNLIVNPGLDFLPDDITKRQHGIYFSDKTTEPDSAYYFFNNTIINPKSDGIRINSTLSKGNLAYNNIIVNPGSYEEYEYDNTSARGIDAFVRKTKPEVEIDTSHNILTLDINSVHFENYEDDNYKLKEESELIDKGLDLSGYNIFFDNENNVRPQGKTFDIGAFESSYSKPDNFPEKMELFEIYPNPANEDFEIKYSLDKDCYVRLYVLDISGRKIVELKNDFQYIGTYGENFSIKDSSSEIIFCVLDVDNELFIKKILLVK